MQNTFPLYAPKMFKSVKNCGGNYLQIQTPVCKMSWKIKNLSFSHNSKIRFVFFLQMFLLYMIPNSACFSA